MDFLDPHELFLKTPLVLSFYLETLILPKDCVMGTRLVCHDFKLNVIYAEIVVGHYRGKRVFIYTKNTIFTNPK
jgi:hypothetical protein